MLHLLLLVPVSLASVFQGPSVKDLFDGRLRALRSVQDPEGSYGSRLDTARVLSAMALCPRAYREDDGPFIRDAARFLLADAESEPRADAASAFALQCLDAERHASRIREFCARAGMPLEAVAGLAARGRLPEGLDASAEWREGLPIPEEGETAAGILQSIPEGSGLATVAEAAARAGVAYLRERSTPPRVVDREAIYARGVDFLLAARGKSGSWEVFGQPEPGISALAAKALLGSNRKEAREAAFRTLDWLKGLQKEDGSIHGGNLPVYVTSAAISALAKAGRPEDREAVRRAAEYLRATQVDDSEGYSESDKFYGGIGYGDDLRPDLSNLQFALQALRDSGAKSEDPAFQRALRFLQRSQNRPESNPEIFREGDSLRKVRAGNDGGAVYYPGNSPAGMSELPDGTWVARSYGSMTYALLKCYVFAGLKKDDPRVAAVIGWIQEHWTLEVNPGFDSMRDPRAGFQGLYYYYLSLAEALHAADLERIVTPAGAEHDWRAELAAKMAELQAEDGSWVNEMAPRWWEGNPVLCTAYALNALQAARD